MALTELDQQILTRIQSGFPLAPAPYAVLEKETGRSASTILERVRALRSEGIIRRIGGSFAAGPVGYVSTLVGAKVDPERLEEAAACAGRFAEVTHNYEREADYNLWFTVIAPNRQRLEAILDTVRAVPGVRALYDLPALQLFKIRVDFRFGKAKRSKSEDGDDDGIPQSKGAMRLDEIDKRIICRACGDVGDSKFPFRELSTAVDIEESELLRRLEAYRKTGAMRRFGAVLRHREAGFTANGMSVWNVPDARTADIGARLAACPEISHCYERPRMPDWPYNVFGMIHGTDRADCIRLAARIAEEVGLTEYGVLFSGREFKKTSMVYFPEAIQDVGEEASGQSGKKVSIPMAGV